MMKNLSGVCDSTTPIPVPVQQSFIMLADMPYTTAYSQREMQFRMYLAESTRVVSFEINTNGVILESYAQNIYAYGNRNGLYGTASFRGLNDSSSIIRAVMSYSTPVCGWFYGTIRMSFQDAKLGKHIFSITNGRYVSNRIEKKIPELYGSLVGVYLPPMYGDANYDSQVTLPDLDYMIEVRWNSWNGNDSVLDPYQILAMDLDGNGDPGDSYDHEQLQEYLVKLRSCFVVNGCYGWDNGGGGVGVTLPITIHPNYATICVDKDSIYNGEFIFTDATSVEVLTSKAQSTIHKDGNKTIISFFTGGNFINGEKLFRVNGNPEKIKFSGEVNRHIPINVEIQSVTGVEENSPATTLPAAFSLSQNYPNPFNPTTTIRFNLPTSERVTLKVLNVLGQEITTLVNNEEMQAGQHEAIFNASGYSSGVYFYRLYVGGKAPLTNHMLLTK